MIYTFYSYKGGVGRSMALANIAELFYRKGLRVLLVDFDLEAPGLEQYFFKKGDPKLAEIQSRRGLIDLLLSYKELRALPPLKVAPKPQSEESDSIGRRAADSDPPKLFPYPVEPLTNFVATIYERTDSTRGELSIVPAGRRLREPTVVGDRDGNSEAAAYQGAYDRTKAKDEFAMYAERVRSFAWDELYIKLNGEELFDWFREKAIEIADVVLIDSRTGVAEMSGICTHQLADVVVMFLAPNNQNVYGTQRIAYSLTDPQLVEQARKGRALDILCVPSRVDLNEKLKVDDFARRFRLAAGNLISTRLEFETDAFIDLKIPYAPYYSFVEEIAVRDADSPVAVELTRAYDKICRALVQLEPDDSIVRERFEDQNDRPINTAEKLNRLAEKVFHNLSEPQQKAALQVFKRLVRLAGAEAEDATDTALRVSYEEFNDPTTIEVISILETNGLLTISKESVSGQRMVQLTDESLINSWPRLRTWLKEDEEFLNWRSVLRTFSRERSGKRNQQQGKKDSSTLLTGSALKEAREWMEKRGDDLTSSEMSFILESASYRRRRLLGTTIALFLPIILAISAGSLWKYRVEQEKIRQQVELTTKINNYLTTGNSSLKAADQQSALIAFNNAINLDPNRAESYLGRGKAYVLRNSDGIPIVPINLTALNAAGADFDKALTLKPDFPEALYERAYVQLVEGNYDSALTDLNNALKQKPDYAEAYYQKGETLRAQASSTNNAVLSNESLEAYNQTIKLKPDYTKAYLGRGTVYADIGNLDPARADFTKVIEQTDIPADRSIAENSLKKIGSSQQMPVIPPATPSIFIEYQSAEDSAILDQITSVLTNKKYKVNKRERVVQPTEGDVRYFYTEDQKVAEEVRALVNLSLNAQHVILTLKMIPLLSVYKNVPRGQIEVWFPPLTNLKAKVRETPQQNPTQQAKPPARAKKKA